MTPYPESASLVQAFGATVGDEPLIVDLQLPMIQPGQVGVLLAASFIATLTTRQPDTRGLPPNSGLFLCPQGTPIETAAEAIAGFNAGARPFALPLNDPYLNVAQVGAAPTYTLQMVTPPGIQHPVPTNNFIRAIIVCQQGSATPGPGLGSRGTLSIFIAFRSQCPC